MDKHAQELKATQAWVRQELDRCLEFWLKNQLHSMSCPGFTTRPAVKSICNSPFMPTVSSVHFISGL